MNHLASYFTELEKKLVIHYKASLLPPDWKMLLDMRCPVCSCKLYQMRSKPRLYCKSRRNKHTFTIPVNKYEEVRDKLMVQ